MDLPLPFYFPERRRGAVTAAAAAYVDPDNPSGAGFRFRRV